MPLFQAERIAWLALESLCNQKKAPQWKLIICEETESKFYPFGENKITKYYNRLKKANCIDLIYIPTEKWVPLSYKWNAMANNTKSEIFIMQSADCYSQPFRISDTYQLLKNSGDWCQSLKGYFYSIANEKIYIYHGEKNNHPCALNMAFRTELAKGLPCEAVVKGVDKWLFQSFENIKGRKLHVKLNRTNHWKLGIDTHGLGTISKRRGELFDKSEVWEKTNIQLEDIIPCQHALRLCFLKESIRNANEYRLWKKQ